MEQVEFEESLKRIADTLIQPNPIIRDSIVLNEVLANQSYLANATVVYFILQSGGESTQAIQSFMSEATKIAMAHNNCKGIISECDRLILIYSTAFKEELNAALDDAARIRSLAMIVSKIGKPYGIEPIVVDVGMDYGLVEMHLMGHDENSRPIFAWRGDVIKKAQKNAEDANDELIISRSIWNNLTESNQKLFTRQSIVTDNFRGKLLT